MQPAHRLHRNFFFFLTGLAGYTEENSRTSYYLAGRTFMDAQDSGRERWQRRFDAAAKRNADFTTLSGLEVDPVYGPPDDEPAPERIGWPGEFPFTRGIHPTGYRGKPWTIRQFSGF